MNIKDFRKFFNIKYQPNLGNLQQFYIRWGNCIPTKIDNDPQLKQITIQYLDNLGHSSNGLYCIGIRRNPKLNKQTHRTVYNDIKASILLPDLYKYFKEDNTISFWFSNDKDKEKTDSEIIDNFSVQLK